MPACPTCGKALPADGLTFCPWCASSLVAAPSVQRKTVSILFCDLVDSTALGSRVDPEVLRRVLEEYWACARSVIERHGGTVEKFIGDAVVGVFGVPALHEDDALRAVRAAQDLLVDVRDLGGRLLARHGVELAVRVGVNTGQVVVGGGTDALMSGDAANVAARLETSAASGEVLIGDATYRLVRDAVDVVPVGPLSVKGKEQPLVAFRLVAARPEASGQPRRRRFSTDLVGRTSQLHLAQAMFATAVSESCCAMLTVVGQPGMGKSRLVDELLTTVDSDAMVLQGRCLPYGEGITYWPAVEMLHRLAEVDSRTVSEWTSGIDHGDEVARALDAMVGLSDGSTGQQISWAFRRLAETLAAERPLVLVVDDLQWAEMALLDLLDHLTDRSRGAPILLVTMARPELMELRPTWSAQRHHAAVTTLAPLPSDQCAEMAELLLGSGAATELRDQIVEAAEGVPLYVEEMVAMLVDDGRLVAAPGGGWQPVSEATQVDVPASIQALVAARLEHLDPEQRSLLDAASVVGKTFYPDALRHLLGDEVEVEPTMDSLVRADLVFPTQTDLPGYEAYGFTHQLTVEAAYQAMSKARRVSLHESAARWVDAAMRSHGAEEVVAFHLERAVGYRRELGDDDLQLRDEAVRRLITLADRTRTLGNASEAVGQANRAVRLAPPDSALAAEAYLAHAYAVRHAGDYTAAVRSVQEAEAQALAGGAEALVWRARLELEELVSWVASDFSPDRALELCDRAIEALSDLRDDEGLAAAYHLRGTLRNEFGQLRKMEEDGRRSLHHARAAGARGSVLARPLWLVFSRSNFGDSTPNEAERTLEEFAEWGGSDPAVTQYLDEERLFLRAYCGDVAGAERGMRDRYQLDLDQGRPANAATWLVWGLAWCRQWNGDLEGAADCLIRGASMLDDAGNTGLESTVLARLSLVLARLGRDEEAARWAAQGRAITRASDRINQLTFAATDGLLRARGGEGPGSEDAFEASLAITALTDFLPTEGEVWLARSEARELLGDQQGALAAAREALVRFEQKGWVPPIAIARAQVARLAT